MVCNKKFIRRTSHWVGGCISRSPQRRAGKMAALRLKAEGRRPNAEQTQARRLCYSEVGDVSAIVACFRHRRGLTPSPKYHRHLACVRTPVRLSAKGTEMTPAFRLKAQTSLSSRASEASAQGTVPITAHSFRIISIRRTRAVSPKTISIQWKPPKASVRLLRCRTLKAFRPSVRPPMFFPPTIRGASRHAHTCDRPDLLPEVHNPDSERFCSSSRRMLYLFLKRLIDGYLLRELGH